MSMHRERGKAPVTGAYTLTGDQVAQLVGTPLNPRMYNYFLEAY
jgi:hypothetical protein